MHIRRSGIFSKPFLTSPPKTNLPHTTPSWTPWVSPPDVFEATKTKQSEPSHTTSRDFFAPPGLGHCMIWRRLKGGPLQQQQKTPKKPWIFWDISWICWWSAKFHGFLGIPLIESHKVKQLHLEDFENWNPFSSFLMEKHGKPHRLWINCFCPSGIPWRSTTVSDLPNWESLV